MSKKASSAISRFFMWGLMGLLIAGLLSFAVTDFGGSSYTVATVGEEEIDTNLYANGLQTELNSFQQQLGTSIPLSTALQFGIDRQVLSTLVTRAALDNETAATGLSVGDDFVRQQVLTTPAFQGLTGEFDREAYADALRRSGLDEEEFEDSLRKDTARGILQGAIVSGIAPSTAMVDAALTYGFERRGFTWARVDATNLPTPVGAPTDADLTAYYEANPEEFTTLEAKKIAYVSLTPEMILDTVEVDETVLRETYDDRIAFYQRDERRLVERLVLGTDAAAAEAKARLDAGEITFDELVAERGLDLADIDLGDQSKDELGDAGDAIFAMAEPGITDPLPTTLGAAIFRMNAIFPAENTSFEDALPSLRDEFAQDRARRVITDSVGDLDDLLAGGATLPEVAEETDAVYGELLWDGTLAEGIAASQAFRAAATAVQDGDFAEVIETEDGAIFALELVETIAPTLEAYDDVVARVISGWEQQETANAVAAHAETIKTALETGTDLASQGLTATVETEVLRTDFIADVPAEFLTTVFATDEGTVSVLPAGDASYVIHTDLIQGPDTTSPDYETAKAGLSDQSSAQIAEDLITAFGIALQNDLDITTNTAVINAVHAQFN